MLRREQPLSLEQFRLVDVLRAALKKAKTDPPAATTSVNLRVIVGDFMDPNNDRAFTVSAHDVVVSLVKEQTTILDGTDDPELAQQRFAQAVEV